MWFLRGEKVERETCWWRRRLFMGHTFLLIYHCIIFHFYGKKGYTHHSQPGRRNKRSTGRLSFLNLKFLILHLQVCIYTSLQGQLSNGTLIAVKQLSSKSRQGNREFVNEIGIISGLQHPNLVKLYGCCIERTQLLLVYEYIENNSLARALFGNHCKICSLQE